MLGLQQSASKVIDEDVVSIKYDDDDSSLIKRNSILEVDHLPDDSMM